MLEKYLWRKKQKAVKQEAHDISTRFTRAEAGISTDTCHSSLEQWAERDHEKTYSPFSS